MDKGLYLSCSSVINADAAYPLQLLLRQTQCAIYATPSSRSTKATPQYQDYHWTLLSTQFYKTCPQAPAVPINKYGYHLILKETNPHHHLQSTGQSTGFHHALLSQLPCFSSAEHRIWPKSRPLWFPFAPVDKAFLNSSTQKSTPLS